MRSPWVGAAVVAVGLFATALLWELLHGILTDNVTLNAFAVVVLGLWVALVVAGVVLVTRARDADPDFRGTLPELLRITSVLMLLLALATWGALGVRRPFEWEMFTDEDECVHMGDVTRCEIGPLDR